MTGIKLIYSLILCILSVSAFVAFLILENYPAAIWGVISGFVNCLSTHIHWLKYKNKLEMWYEANDLRRMMYVGQIFFTLGTTGFVYHLVTQILAKTPILPINTSEAIPLIWCFIMTKSAFALFYYAYIYKNSNNDMLIFEDSQVNEPNSNSD